MPEDFKPEVILAQNVKALMGTKGGPNTQAALAERSGVAQATIGRILNPTGKNAARIDTVTAIAKAYGLEGWQLMVAGMNPTNPPVLQPVTAAERALYDRLKDTIKDLAKLGDKA